MDILNIGTQSNEPGAANRHPEGHTVFGNNDELQLKLQGTCPGKIARYVGTAEQFPGVLLEGDAHSQ
jgi:hypothetical protein